MKENKKKSFMNVYIFIYFLFCFVSFLIYCCRQYDDYFLVQSLLFVRLVFLVLFSFYFDLSQVQYKREKKATSMNEKKNKQTFFVLFGFHFIADEKKLEITKRETIYVFQDISFILLISTYVNFILIFLRALTCFM